MRRRHSSKYAQTRGWGGGGYPPEKQEITADFWFWKTIHHLPCFIKTHLLKQNPYDETLKIVSDWKFFLQEFIFNNRSYRAINLIVAYYDKTGISSVNFELRSKERQEVLYSMFPKQLVDDVLSTIAGRTPLERMINRSKPDGMINKILFRIGLFLSKFEKPKVNTETYTRYENNTLKT